ncbi:MAG: hypothetical protein K0A98_06605 [Trueperaceae bacterium]|nr:hypothetical protein [Trueperaceae bacterium]
MTFTHGEEVLVDGVRYVISAIEGQPPTRYRLLATTPQGPRVRWAAPGELRKIEAYTKQRSDTAHVMRYR